MDTHKTKIYFPAIKIWIEHLLRGEYSEQEGLLYTIFGKIKRVRILGTVIKKENAKIRNQITSLDLEIESNDKLIFTIDDGTGLINATLWGVDLEKYSSFEIGKIVDILGSLNIWEKNLTINIEFIKIIEDPNLLLLQSAEILKKLKFGKTFRIPSKEEIKKINRKDVGIKTLFEDDV